MLDHVGSHRLRQKQRGCEPTVERMTTLGRPSFVRGLDIKIEFDEDAYKGGGVYLFAAVLERFLALYASVNSFTKLTAHLSERDKKPVKWPARTGQAVLA